MRPSSTYWHRVQLAKVIAETRGARKADPD